MLNNINPVAAIALLSLILAACSADGSRYHGSSSPGVGTATQESTHVGGGATKPRGGGAE